MLFRLSPKSFNTLKIIIVVFIFIVFTSFLLNNRLSEASQRTNNGSCIRCVQVGRGWYECRSGFRTGGIECISEGSLCQHDGLCRSR